MNHKYHFESQTIRWSVIVLCLSLILVYVVLYYAKWDLWKMDLVSDNLQNTWDILITDMDYYLNEDSEQYWLYTGMNTWLNIESQNMTGLIVTWNNYIVTWSSNTWVFSITKNTQRTWDELENMIILSGTKTYYWELDFVDKLWISYSYALIDTKRIYYLNMWNYKYDFSDIARKLKWSLYVMNTDQELISNTLFGDKITFINIPEYKNKKVLFLLDINNQSWLLAIDYEIYHQVKPYLKSLFIY